MIKWRFWKGLWGCSSKGIIYTPRGRPVLWLPKYFAFKLHTFLNKHQYISPPFEDEQIDYIKKLARDVLFEELQKAANPNTGGK